MANDPRGRWFRVYARQVRQHPKFRRLTYAELGAWTELRAAAEMLDGEPFVDRADALLVLQRREKSRTKCTRLLDRLVDVRLLDEDDRGVGIHDLEDHDRGAALDPGQQQHRRDHRRVEPTPGCEWCGIERWDRSAGTNGMWLPRGVDVDSPRGPAKPSLATEERSLATESTPPRGPMLQASELPSESDSATLACRQLFDSGKWLGDREYVAAWEDMDRRYSAAWVRPRSRRRSPRAWSGAGRCCRGTSSA